MNNVAYGESSEADAGGRINNSMPMAVYFFSLMAFALGLAEFVPIGMTNVIAEALHKPVQDIGGIVTAYALGATFSAPILSAFTAGWSRKRVMICTAAVFSLGSLVAALSNALAIIVAARFVAGMGHGLFLAVASSVAARLAGSQRSGTAVAVVFGGFTAAMAVGVPLSTYMGSFVSWKLVFGCISLFGILGLLGLFIGMPESDNSERNSNVSLVEALRPIVHGRLLAGALVTVLAYAGSFAAYTYIEPLLIEKASISIGSVSGFMLGYGIAAAIGNVAGGRMTDGLGIAKANIFITAGISVVVLGMFFFCNSPVLMFSLVVALGFLSYAAVPALQARLLNLAERFVPHAHGVAAGLNIAGFNSGIALGSVVGGITIRWFDISYVGLVAFIIAGSAFLFLLFQEREWA